MSKLRVPKSIVSALAPSPKPSHQCENPRCGKSFPYSEQRTKCAWCGGRVRRFETEAAGWRWFNGAQS